MLDPGLGPGPGSGPGPGLGPGPVHGPGSVHGPGPSQMFCSWAGQDNLHNNDNSYFYLNLITETF